MAAGTAYTSSAAAAGTAYGAGAAVRPHRFCPPRHRVPFDSRIEGSLRWMTWRAMCTRPWAAAAGSAYQAGMGAARHASGASLSTGTGLPDQTWKVHCVEKLDGEAEAAHCAGGASSSALCANPRLPHGGSQRTRGSTTQWASRVIGCHQVCSAASSEVVPLNRTVRVIRPTVLGGGGRGRMEDAVLIQPAGQFMLFLQVKGASVVGTRTCCPPRHRHAV